uniref:Putative secreted protein n=1 Tax=Ixodes scapularis TaxID=6945 RepID=A0A4D5RF26_IXOSC
MVIIVDASILSCLHLLHTTNVLPSWQHVPCGSQPAIKKTHAPVRHGRWQCLPGTTATSEYMACTNITWPDTMRKRHVRAYPPLR